MHNFHDQELIQLCGYGGQSECASSHFGWVCEEREVALITFDSLWHYFNLPSANGWQSSLYTHGSKEGPLENRTYLSKQSLEHLSSVVIALHFTEARSTY